jgi:hypothetical protein
VCAQGRATPDGARGADRSIQKGANEMTNLKPADELLSVRQKIKDLQAREAELKDAMMKDPALLAGDFAVASLVKRGSTRFDRKAAEAELGSLARFDVKGETIALMVNELAQVVE